METESKKIPKWLQGYLVFNERCLIQARNYSAQFASSLYYDEKPYWLSFYGTSGAGKTHLARLVWQWYQRCGCYHLDDQTGITTMREGYFAHWPTIRRQLAAQNWSLVDSLIQKHFLVLDEIKESGEKTDVFRDALADIISCRMGKWTILTCNLNLEQIGAQIDPRVSSRMIRDGNRCVHFNCPDYSTRRL